MVELSHIAESNFSLHDARVPRRQPSTRLQALGPVYMVSGTRDNPPPRDNFTERLYGVASCNSCPL